MVVTAAYEKRASAREVDLVRPANRAQRPRERPNKPRVHCNGGSEIDCSECGDRFRAFHSGQLACSKICSRRRQERRRIANGYYRSEKYRERQRRRDRTTRPSGKKKGRAPLPARSCEHCGWSFIPKSKRNFLCSLACLKKSNLKRAADVRAAERASRPLRFCCNCGEAIDRHRRKGSLTCGFACSEAVKNARALKNQKLARRARRGALGPRACLNCGISIDTLNITARFCFNSCRGEFRRSQMNIEIERKKEREADRKRSAKAKGFDAILQLLEKSNVDAATKDAIGRLRGLVEGEQSPTPQLLGEPPQAATERDGGRH